MIAHDRVDIRVGDCRTLLRAMPAESVDCVVTSPPYFGLRDYGAGDAEIGREPTPAEFVAALVDVFREVRRVLRPSGTAWVNLGDSYAGSWGSRGRQGSGGLMADRAVARNRTAGYQVRAAGVSKKGTPPAGIKPKDLMMLPARLAIALCDDGWRLRSDIIWHKPNAMPESITDRPTSAHEHVFLLTKARRYFYDAAAIAEPATQAERRATFRGGAYCNGSTYDNSGPGGKSTETGNIKSEIATRNARNVWTIATEPFTGAHYAVMPTKLAERCILAGTSAKGYCSDCGAPWERQIERVDQGYNGSRYGERAVAATGGARSGGTARSTLGSSNGRLTGKTETVGWAATCDCGAAPRPGLVLDPFGGADTTGTAAAPHGRRAILLELSPQHAETARARIAAEWREGRAAPTADVTPLALFGDAP